MRQIHLIGRFSSINARPPRLFKEGFTFPVHSLNLFSSLARDYVRLQIS